MKFVVLFAVLFIAYLIWRSNNRAEERAERARRTPPPPALPQEMVSCQLCGLHLPAPEAVADAKGRYYCSPEHRQRAARQG